MPVAEAQRQVNPIEYLRWRIVFQIEEEEKWDTQDRADLYAAQIAFQVYLLRHIVSQMWSKNPRSPEQSYKDFVFDFKKAIKQARKKLPPKQVKAIEAADDEWSSSDTLELVETEEERQERFERANLDAHNRWAGFFGVTLSQVGADKYVKGPDEIADRSTDDAT